MMGGRGDCCDGDGAVPGIIIGSVIVSLSRVLVLGILKELLQLRLL
jgi:hypothetical protein